MSRKTSRREKRGSPLVPGLVAVAVLALALWLLLANVVFVVREVRVAGAGEVPETEVLHLCGIPLGKRMSAVREDDVRLDVESDGRLAFVSLDKRYPNQLLLTVRPRTRDALMQEGGKTLVLDSEGYVCQILDQMPDERIPFVSGLKASHYTLGRQLDTADGRCLAMHAILEALKARGATAYVSEISVEDVEDLRIITRTGMTVLLGDADNMEDKIAWMAGALADLEARGETSGRLDVASGTKADFKPRETPEPDGKLYGYDSTDSSSPEETPTPVPVS